MTMRGLGGTPPVGGRGLGRFFGALNQGLQQMDPIQRAGLLRMAAGNTRSPAVAQGLIHQADDLVSTSEQAKLNAIRQKQFDTEIGLRREQLGMQRQERADQLARTDAFRMDMQKWLTAQTPEDRQAVLGSSTSPEFLEYVGSQKPTEPNAFDAKLISMGLTPGTPEWQNAARQMALKPDTNINMGLNKPPTGYMFIDPQNPAAGVVPIPGGPATERTPEQAAKEQMLEVARAVAPEIQNLLFDEDGRVDRTNLFSSRIGSGVPFSEGREMAARFETGIQAITRGETGAAMPPQEVENTRKRFQPHPLDSDETIRLKWQMYNDFINGTLNLLKMSKGGDPLPLFDAQAFEAEFERRKGSEPSQLGVGESREVNGVRITRKR